MIYMFFLFMQTKIINIEENAKEASEASLDALRNHGVICFPTETVYGLGCSLFDDHAVGQIFDLKRRSFSKPLSAHIGKIQDVDEIAINIPDSFYLLAEKFLPGPLAIILEKNNKISDKVTSGMNTIGIRFPDHDFLLSLINKLGCPIAGTSANLSNESSTVSGKEAYSSFNGLIPIVLDDGVTKYQKESTVISIIGKKPVCYREGVIKKTQLEELLSVKFQ
jgi:L-threonylcarbamoyladenylate synthase